MKLPKLTQIKENLKAKYPQAFSEERIVEYIFFMKKS